MGLLVACEGRPTGMTLGLLPTSLTAIFRYVLPIGKAHPLIHLLHLDRAPVRIGIRGGIVAIEHARASKVAIVSIAQTDRAANGVSEGSTCSLQKSGAKLLHFYGFSKSKSEFNNLYIWRGPRPEARRPPFGGGVLCALRAPLYAEGTVSSVSNGSVNSQRTAPQTAAASEGAR